MELKDYVKILNKNLSIIAACSLLGILIAIFMTKSQPNGYFQSQTLYIFTPSTQNQQNGSFYSQEQSRNFTDTAVAILESADFKSQVVSQGSIRVKKLAPQVINLTIFASDQRLAQSLMENTVSSFNSKLTQLTEGQNQMQLKQIAPTANPSKIIVNTKVYALSGLIVGLAFAILAVSLKTYFRL